MAFGTGSAIAHRAVGAAAEALTGGGSSSSNHSATPDQIPRDQMMQPAASSVGPCADDKQMFFECLKVNQGDQRACSFLYETLQACQRNSTEMSFQ